MLPHAWPNSELSRSLVRRRRALKAVESLFTPLLPDDYLELINPLWSTRELRGRVERLHHETEDAVTILIRPGHEWPGHEPGQYARIGLVVDGIHHWRAYSLTSDPRRPDGWISITPKLVPEARCRAPRARARPGMIVRLGGRRGHVQAARPTAREAALHQRRSGITPIMSMLRNIRPP
jgi:ferredoxin-NADP reductase